MCWWATLGDFWRFGGSYVLSVACFRWVALGCGLRCCVLV